jgi:hypothetical protein
MNNPLSGIDPTGYVGCGDLNIKGGPPGTFTSAPGDGGNRVEIERNSSANVCDAMSPTR